MKGEEKREALEALKGAILRETAFLTSTDYVSAKLAEGVATKEEYADILAKRQSSRANINEAQRKIAELEKIEAEPEAEAPAF